MSRPLVFGSLFLTVHAIENLRSSSSFPYVHVSVGSQQHHTAPKPAGPIHASFSFQLASERSEDQYLRVEVRDDSLKGSQEVGGAVVPLQEVTSWRGAHRIDLVAPNGVDLCGAVVLTAEYTPGSGPQQQPSMYPNVSRQPAYNPAFSGAPVGAAEPPPPYQQVDPYAAQQQPPQQYAQPGPFSPSSYFAPPQYSPQPQGQPLPAQPLAFHPPAPNGSSWPPQPMPPMQPPPQQVQTVTQTVMLPPFGADVKDPRHQHPLRHQPTLYNGQGYACNLCRREQNANGFHCAVCNFDMCPQCFARQAIGASGGGGGAVRDVRHPHALHWQHLTGLGYRNGYRCDGCGNAGRGESWHCQMCSFDLHQHCLRPVS